MIPVQHMFYNGNLKWTRNNECGYHYYLWYVSFRGFNGSYKTTKFWFQQMFVTIHWLWC